MSRIKAVERSARRRKIRVRSVLWKEEEENLYRVVESEAFEGREANAFRGDETVVAVFVSWRWRHL